MRSPPRALRALAVALALLLPGAAACPAWAHATPQQQSPAAGETLARAPTVVRITFDEALVGRGCEIRVEDARKRLVSRGHARVDPAQPRVLEVALEPLAPGTYDVSWIAISRDGHRTRGDYSFTVSP